MIFRSVSLPKFEFEVTILLRIWLILILTINYLRFFITWNMWKEWIFIEEFER